MNQSAQEYQDTSFFGHPKGLMTLFFTEMWERMSFYGMRGILVLFMTASLIDGGLAIDAVSASGNDASDVSIEFFEAHILCMA